MNMRYVNERRDFCCHVVHQVLMLYVPDMSGPSHVAPSLPATFDINRRSRGNDGLDPMMRAGSCSQVQPRRALARTIRGRSTATKCASFALLTMIAAILFCAAAVSSAVDM